MEKLNELAQIDSYNSADFRTICEQYAGNTAVVGQAETLSQQYAPDMVYEILKDLIVGYGIENVTPDMLTEEVTYESDSYDDDAQADSFDAEAENYDTIVKNARENRVNGQRLLNSIDNFTQTAVNMATAKGIPLNTLLTNFLQNNPEALFKLRTFVSKEGYVPTNDIQLLAAQVAHVYNEKVNNRVAFYDPYVDADNFLPAALLLTGKKAKKRRQERSKQRIADRNERRQMRRSARIDRREMTAQAKRKRNMADAENNREISEIEYVEPQTEVTETQGMELPPSEAELMGISSDTAQEEILGEEFGDSCYDGEPDNFLPFFAGALKLGSNVMADAGRDRNPLTKDNLEQFRDLFRKKGNKKYKPTLPSGRTMTGADTAKTIINDATGKIISDIEKQRTRSFVRENAGLIIVGVLVLVIVGASLK